jgi:hypothetical protein
VDFFTLFHASSVDSGDAAGQPCDDPPGAYTNLTSTKVIPWKDIVSVPDLAAQRLISHLMDPHFPATIVVNNTRWIIPVWQLYRRSDPATYHFLQNSAETAGGKRIYKEHVRRIREATHPENDCPLPPGTVVTVVLECPKWSQICNPITSSKALLILIMREKGTFEEVCMCAAVKVGDEGVEGDMKGDGETNALRFMGISLNDVHGHILYYPYETMGKLELQKEATKLGLPLAVRKGSEDELREALNDKKISKKICVECASVRCAPIADVCASTNVNIVNGSQPETAANRFFFRNAVFTAYRYPGLTKHLAGHSLDDGMCEDVELLLLDRNRQNWTLAGVRVNLVSYILCGCLYARNPTKCDKALARLSEKKSLELRDYVQQVFYKTVNKVQRTKGGVPVPLCIDFPKMKKAMHVVLHSKEHKQWVRERGFPAPGPAKIGEILRCGVAAGVVKGSLQHRYLLEMFKQMTSQEQQVIDPFRAGLFTYNRRLLDDTVQSEYSQNEDTVIAGGAGVAAARARLAEINALALSFAGIYFHRRAYLTALGLDSQDTVSLCELVQKLEEKKQTILKIIPKTIHSQYSHTWSVKGVQLAKKWFEDSGFSDSQIVTLAPTGAMWS